MTEGRSRGQKEERKEKKTATATAEEGPGSIKNKMMLSPLRLLGVGYSQLHWHCYLC
jgi:hypothetical protein